MELAPGVQESNQLQAAGFSTDEILQWQSDTRAELQSAGFSQTEINEYFGDKTPDMSNFENKFKNNLAKAEAKGSEGTGSGQTGQGPKDPSVPPPVKEAKTFLEAFEAGWDVSVLGLQVQMKNPDVALAEKPEMFMRIASQVGTLAGDLPYMISGGVIGAGVGGAAGGAVGAGAGTLMFPGAGTAAGAAVGTGAGVIFGAGAGAMAFPEALRTYLMQQYEKGEVTSFSDWWERASAITINTLKAATIGGATSIVGGAVGGAVAKTAAPAVVKTTTQLASEVATMTTVGSALEGHVPEPEEFVDAAILTAGLHGTVKASTKIRNMYAKHGKTPAEVAFQADKDYNLKQQILSENVPIPTTSEMGPKPPNPTPPETFDTSKAVKADVGETSPEVKTIMSKVSAKPEVVREGYDAKKAYKDFVDKLDPLNQATNILKEAGTELPADKNPYILQRVAVDAPAKAKHFFDKGTLDFHTLEKNGKGLTEIKNSVRNHEEYTAYRLSKRAVEEAKVGKNAGFDLEAAKAVIKQHEKEYEPIHREEVEFSNRTLKYVYDAGIITKESYNNMLGKLDYVPIKRILTPEVAAGKKSGKAGSLKAFKGSDLNTQDPTLTMVENTIDLIRLAEENRSRVALVELAEKSKGQTLIEKVKPEMRPTEVTPKELMKELERQGIDVSEPIAESMTVFRSARRELAPDEFSLYRNGKREVYRTTPEIAEAFRKTGNDAITNSMLFKTLRAITSFKRILITGDPTFQFKNQFRDYLTGGVYGKGITFKDVVSAMGDIWSKNDNYYNWLKSGGANGAFLEMGERYISKNVLKLQEQTNFMGSVRNLLEKPVDVMRLAGELSEQSVRVAEFKKVLGNRKGRTAITEAGYSAREVTLDFQRIGAKLAHLNAITAFMNVSIQGLDKSVRAFKKDPVKMGTRAALYITAPSILLWWANKDDQRYKEAPQWEKDLFWIIPTDNWVDAVGDEAEGLEDYLVRQKDGKTQINKGTIYRLPKPQELGILFGSLPERTLEAFFADNPDAMKEFDETMKGLVTPSFVPDAVAPAVEQYFNKSFFTGRDIVPHHLKGQLPEYQYTEYTSESAKTIGKFVGQFGDFETASPVVIDNYIRSWGGSLGQYAVQVSDQLLLKTGVVEDKVKPTQTLSDTPFIRSFVVRYPLAGSDSIQKFFDTYEKNVKVFNTVQKLYDSGDVNEAEKLMKKRYEEFVIGKMTEGMKIGFSRQSEVIRNTHNNPEISADEKRRIIDSLYLQMITLARGHNKAIREVQEQIRENLKLEGE